MEVDKEVTCPCGCNHKWRVIFDIDESDLEPYMADEPPHDVRDLD